MQKNTIKIRFGAVVIALAVLSNTGIAFAKEKDEFEGYGGNHDKVEICHKGKSIEVNFSALAKHLAHGDALGECEEDRDEGNKKDKDEAHSAFHKFADIFWAYFHR